MVLVVLPTQRQRIFLRLRVIRARSRHDCDSASSRQALSREALSRDPAAGRQALSAL